MSEVWCKLVYATILQDFGHIFFATIFPMCSPPFLKASRIGGELGSAAVKLVEEATGRSDAGADGGAGGAGAEPLESYFCARSPREERKKAQAR